MFRRINLTGARVLITGASSGIGRALAEELTCYRPRLVLAARSTDQLSTLADAVQSRGAQAIAVPTDVTNPEHRRRLIDRTVEVFGGLDILINNAGIGASGHFSDVTEERLRRIFEVNFFGATELTRLAIPQLKGGRDPMIVNIASVLGRRGVPGYTEYCASKFAMCGWSEGLRAELAGFGIHVLLVCPGLIATEFPSHMLEERFETSWTQGRKMSPTRCARIIIRAIRQRRNEITITLGGKFLRWINGWAPRLVDYYLAKYLAREQREQMNKSAP